MKGKKIMAKVFIMVKDGLIEGIRADEQIEVVIYDCDSQDIDDNGDRISDEVEKAFEQNTADMINVSEEYIVA